MAAHRYDFASDNTAPAMPEVVEALIRFNTDSRASYATTMCANRRRI